MPHHPDRTVASEGAADGGVDAETLAFVRAASGASEVVPGETVQPLWSGYGRVQRLALGDGAGTARSAILKRVDPDAAGAHPRGWDGDLSHRRKRESYAVEARFYERHAARCDDACRVPALLGAFERGEVRALLLEDLDAAFPARREALDVDGCEPCLGWLAAFHARFMHDPGEGLWPTGCYWHLGTRPDELRAMPDSPIRRAAPALDRALSEVRFRSLVHGDAKLANFCFDATGARVAALDFQYVGRGCGMRDVVYFLGSALSDAHCRRHETRLLDAYFGALRVALGREGRAADADAIESEWRSLYAIAWTDFLRFLLGWMPTHRKVSPYAHELAGRALDGLARRS